MKFKGLFKVEIRDKNGKVKKRLIIPNGIVNDGKIKILDTMFHADSQITTWYVGLINGASTPSLAVTDVMISHPGWSEFVNYDEANRQAWSEAAAVYDSVVKMVSTAPSIFTISTDSSQIAGLFITSDNTKSGTSGILWSTALFSAVQNLDDGDTLKVEYEVSVT